MRISRINRQHDLNIATTTNADYQKDRCVSPKRRSGVKRGKVVKSSKRSMAEVNVTSGCDDVVSSPSSTIRTSEDYVLAPTPGSSPRGIKL
jgi:hypothetical protein